jgi:hypothetical protein
MTAKNLKSNNDTQDHNIINNNKSIQRTSKIINQTNNKNLFQ